MLSILLCFICVLMTSFLIGFCLQNILFDFFCVDFTKQRTIYSILLGVITLTIYAQIISLFFAVTYIWAIIAMAIAIILAIAFRKKLLQQIKITFQKVKWYEWILFSLLLLFTIVISNAIPSQYDNYLYQAQNIRSYEEYGVIRGFANIHSRFGFNSSIFSLMALFSFKSLLGQSLHAINALFAFIAFAYITHTLCHFRERRYHIRDALGLVLLFYFFKNTDLISCVGTDMPALIFETFSVMIYASLIEDHEKDTTLYGIVALFIIYLISIKLSMVILVLLVIHPAFYMIKNREWKKIFIFIICGVFIIFPFIVRNVIQTGWLVYPLSAVDLFQVSWKVPYETLVAEAQWVYSWARIPGAEFVGNAPISTWFPTWWINATRETHNFFIGSTIIFVIEFIKAIYGLIRKKKEIVKWLLLKTMFLAGFIYWTFSAPDIRFGWCFLYSMPFIFIPSSYFLSLFEQNLGYKLLLHKVFYIFVQLIVILCIMKIFIKLDVSKVFFDNLTSCNTNNELWIMQPDYDRLDVVGYNINGLTFYYSESSDKTGYYGFPGVITKEHLETIVPMGTSLKDGVRTK